MKSGKLLIILLTVIISFNVAYATYNINLNVLPSRIDDEILLDRGKDFLVFGYVNVVDESLAEPLGSLRIQVIDDRGRIVSSHSPVFVSKTQSDYIFDGYFYTTTRISSSGEYTVRAIIGEHSRDFRAVTVDNFNNMKINVSVVDYAVNNGRLKLGVRVENRISEARDITLQLFGEANFKNPELVSVSLDAWETTMMELDYPVSKFGSSNFIVAAGAYSGDYFSNPSFIRIDGTPEKNSYHRENLQITQAYLAESTIFPGEIVEGTAYVSNKGTTYSLYRFEILYNNRVFRQGEVRRIEAGETSIERFFIEVPNQDSVRVTFRVYNDVVSEEFARTFLVSSRSKNFMISTDSPERIDAGEEETAILKLFNTGNQPDFYFVSLSGWDKLKIETTSFVLEPSQNTEIPITISIPEETRVGEYDFSITVCNTEEKCIERELSFEVIRPEEEQTIIYWDETLSAREFKEIEESIEFEIGLMNLGSLEKSYTMELISESEMEYSISDLEFSLEVDERKDIAFEIFPVEEEDAVVELILYSGKQEIFREELILSYVPEKESMITGMLVYVSGGASSIGIAVLAFLGIGIMAYLFMRQTSKKFWTKNVIDYTQKHPQNLTKYGNTGSYQQYPGNRQP